MFKIGDVVEITDSSDITGMLDFKKGKGYEVEKIQYNFNGDFRDHIERHQEILLRDEGGRTDWYHYTHFKLKGEEVMEDAVKFKIGDTLVCTETNPVELSANSITTGEEYVVTGLWELGVRVVNDDGEERGVCDYRFKLKEDTVESSENHFKAGQTVWCILYGKGVITNVDSAYQSYPIDVRFPDGTRSYTVEGSLDKEFARTLFFSEPKIEAATEPLFVPSLQVGTPIILSKYDVSSQMIPAWVTKETEDIVIVSTTDSVNRVFYKKEWNIYSVGGKINFK